MYPEVGVISLARWFSFLCIHQPSSLGFRDRVAEFLGGIQPESYGVLGVFQGVVVGCAVRHTAGKLRDFSDAALVGVVPVNDYFVSKHPYLRLYLRMISLIALT